MITVVIPSYKSAHLIKRGIFSVLDEGNIVSKVIVVEDGIYDDTEAVLSEFDSKVQHIQLKDNVGAQKARNIGLASVNTDYVMFLDSDDYIKKGFLKGLANKLCSKANYDLALGRMLHEGEKIQNRIFHPPQNEAPLDLVKRWLLGNPGPHPCGVLWSSEFIREIGGWNEKLKKNQDGELMIRAGLNNARITSSDESFCVYVHHAGERVSSNLSRYSIHSQQIIVDSVENYLRNHSDEDLQDALNQFRYYVSVNAFMGGHYDLAVEWEEKWKSQFRLKAAWKNNGLFRFSRLICSYLLGTKLTLKAWKLIRR